MTYPEPGDMGHRHGVESWAKRQAQPDWVAVGGIISLALLVIVPLCYLIFCW